ncbi:hypothetical protein D3C81_720000 [compost metagenome]
MHACLRSRNQVQLQCLRGHGIQRVRMTPGVGTHHLPVDAVGEQLRLRRTLEYMVEPRQTQRLEINARHCIRRIALHRWRYAGLHREVLIRADQQRVVGIRPLPQMLAEVMQYADLCAIEIAGGGQHRNVDIDEGLALRNLLLPVGVIGRMTQPFGEQRIGAAVDGREVAIGAAAAVEVAIKRRPTRTVAVGVVVQRAVAGGVGGPCGHEVEEDTAFHRHIDAWRDRGRGSDGLQRLGPLLQCCPLGEAAITSAVHADPAVAPWLPGDPLDDGSRIGTVMHVRRDGIGAAALAATVGNHAGVAMGGHLLGVGPRPVVVGVNGEGEQGRQRRGSARAHGENGEAGVVGSAYQRGAVDRITARIILCQRFVEQRLERAIGRMHLPGADDIYCLGLRQLSLAGNAGQRLVQVVTHAGQVAAECEFSLQCGAIV